jgi:hypothetical protein
MRFRGWVSRFGAPLWGAAVLGFCLRAVSVQSCPNSACFGPIRGAGLRAGGEFAFFLRFCYISGLRFQFAGFWRIPPPIAANRVPRSDLASPDSRFLGRSCAPAGLQSAPFFFNRRARFPFGSCLILTDSDARGFKKVFFLSFPFFLIAWRAGLPGEFICLGALNSAAKPFRKEKHFSSLF